MSVRRLFVEHPASVGQTYLQHFRAAMSFSLALFGAAACCAIHAVLPFLFETTASDRVETLHERMCVDRSRLNESAPGSAQRPNSDALEGAGSASDAPIES